jgi:DNA repair exonuclease SbcCD ATPase subunit
VADFSNQQQSLYEEYNVTKWTEIESKYKNRLHEIKDSLFKLIAKRTDANNLREKADYAIKSGEYQLMKINSEIELHEVTKNNLVADIKKHEDKLVELEAQYKKLEEEEISINQHIAVVNKFETIIKRDFRGYLLQDIIVYIDKRAKEYSKTIFGTDLINFSLDGNNISITYNNKSYEALSGGERQKVDIIVQFAIRDVLCAYTGFHTNIIVLDEIFDNLDDVGSRRVIDLISHQLTDISAIFIISHHAKELNLPYDREIVIRKDENGVSSLV